MSSEPPPPNDITSESATTPTDGISEAQDIHIPEEPDVPELEVFNLLDLPIELISRICDSIPLFERRTRKDTAYINTANTGLDAWEYNIAEVPDSRNDLSNLRLTCRFMNDIIEPIIFSEVLFHFSPERPGSEQLVEDLKKMADGTHAVCRHTKSLFVVQLTTIGLVPVDEEATYVFPEEEREPLSEEILLMEQNITKVLRRGHAVNKYFRDAIANMKNLERVAIIVKDDTDASYTPHILDSMKGLPLLEEIYFSGNQMSNHSLQFQNLAMDGFTHLRRIDIDGFGFEDPEHTITKNMADMFATANLWTHVKLNDFLGLALTDVVKALEPARELTCLDLQLYDMKIGPQVQINYAQFSCLTSLNLISRDDPVDPKFWTGLRKEHIQLQKLYTDGLSQEFFEYITSYAGLQHLEVHMYNTVPYFRPTDDELENLATTALVAHSATLTNLQFNVSPAAYRGLWFGKMFRNHIKMCPNLFEYGGTFHCNEFKTEVEELVETLVTGPRRWIDHFTAYCSHATTRIERPEGVVATPKIYQSALSSRWLSSLEIHSPANYPTKVEFRAISSTFKLLFKDGAYRYLLLPDSHPESFQSEHTQWLQNPYYFSPFFCL